MRKQRPWRCEKKKAFQHESSHCQKDSPSCPSEGKADIHDAEYRSNGGWRLLSKEWSRRVGCKFGHTCILRTCANAASLCFFKSNHIMIKNKHFVFLILFSLGVCSNQLSGQNIPYPGAQLTRPFSPGGFNTIGNASVSGYGSLFDGNGLPITFEVDGGAAGQKMDVFSIDYPAALGSQFSVVFSFINTTPGIPTSFFGQQINFLNGNPTAQFQGGRQ